MKNFCVSVIWDPEAQVYVADSDSIPGLVAESSSLRGLIDKLQALIPELMELNRHLIDAPQDQVLSINTISISADFQKFEKEFRAA